MSTHHNKIPAKYRGVGLWYKGDTIYVTIRHKHVPSISPTKPLVLCTGTSDPKQAHEFRRQKIAAMIVNDQEVAARGIRMSELYEDYIAHLRRREKRRGDDGLPVSESNCYKVESLIKVHLTQFKDLKPEQITTPLLNKLVDDMHEEYSVSSVNSVLRVLRAVLGLGAKSEPPKVNRLRIPRFPIDAQAEEARARHGIIDDQAEKKIMAELPQHLKPMFATAIHTGLRAKELRSIKREHAEWEKFRINVWKTKNGSPRPVPINDELMAILRAWEERTERDYPNAEYFFHKDGRRVGASKTAWHAALERAGYRVKDESGKWKNLVMFHDTRRTAETRDDEIEIAERDRMIVRGHKTVSQSRRYNQSTLAAERARQKQNEAIAKKRAGTLGAAPEPQRGKDLKAELAELKELFDGGLLPEDIYKSEVAKVVATRQ
jgi:integrase